MDNVDDVVKHFGVKGMRWGVRRAKGPASRDHRRQEKLQRKIKKSRGTRGLSNEELRDFVNRANLERQYNQLSRNTPKKKVLGFIGDTMLDIGRQEATRLARDFVVGQVRNALSRI